MVLTRIPCCMCRFQVKDILLSEGAKLLQHTAEHGNVKVLESLVRILQEVLNFEQVGADYSREHRLQPFLFCITIDQREKFTFFIIFMVC